MRRQGLLSEAINARKRLRTRDLLPTRITLKITSRCNLRCEFCELGRWHVGVELPYEAIVKLLVFARQHRQRVFFGGGEPLLHTRIWDILEFCLDNGLKVSLVTNGTLLPGVTKEQQHLLNETISMMSLSIDGSTASAHDEGRGVPGSFDRAVGYLDNPNRTHPLGLNTLLAVDFGNVRPMVDFARTHRASINFLPILFETSFPDLPRAEWKDCSRRLMSTIKCDVEVLRRASEYARQQGVTTNLDLLLFYIAAYYKNDDSNGCFFDQLFPRFHCFTPLNALTVGEKGEIMLCTLVSGSASMHVDQWLEQWREQATQFRDAWERGHRFPGCKSCSCHFAENLRCNVVAHPLANSKHLGWFTSYYTRRWIRGEGRVR